MQKGTQAKILESAENLFWHQGHKATSLDAIARQAGQSKGAVFHYFRNKNDVTMLVLKKYAEEELYAPLDRAFDGPRNVKEALLGWIEGIYKSYSDQRYQGGCLLGNMALDRADRDEDLRAEILKVFLEWENKLTGYLKEHAKDGQMMVEPRQFARILISNLEGIYMMAKVHKDSNRAGREFMTLAQLIEIMIRD